jgi:hypothetical protein
MNTLPKKLPLGRLSDLLSRSDADRIGIKAGKGVFDEYSIKLWNTRGELLEDCRKGDNGIMKASWKPLVKE